LIPYGLYTLWNVLETNPFKDEPLGEFGVGKHSVVADGSGRGAAVRRVHRYYYAPMLTGYGLIVLEGTGG